MLRRAPTGGTVVSQDLRTKALSQRGPRVVISHQTRARLQSGPPLTRPAAASPRPHVLHGSCVLRRQGQGQQRSVVHFREQVREDEGVSGRGEKWRSELEEEWAWAEEEAAKALTQQMRSGPPPPAPKARRRRVRAELCVDLPTRTTIKWSNTVALWRVAERTTIARTQAQKMAKLSEIHRRMKLADQVKRPKRPSGAQVAAMRAERSAGAKSNVTVGVKRKAKKRGKKSTPLMYMSRREEGELVERYQRWQRVQDIRMKIVAELGCVATPEVMAQWLELPGGAAALEQIEGLGHEAQERLRAKHLNLIRQAAWRHRGEGMPVDELVTEGMSVLERALRTFDPHRGASFGTYLISIVHNAMFDATALRKHCTAVPQAMVSKHRKVRRAIAALEEGEEPWRAAEADAVAEVAGLRVADVAACMNGLLNFREHSLEALHPSTLEGVHEAVEDFNPSVPDPTTHGGRPSQLFQYGVAHSVCAALGQLPARERFVLERVFGLARRGLRATMVEVAAEMMLTPAGVRYIRNTALARMSGLPEMQELRHLLFHVDPDASNSEQSQPEYSECEDRQQQHGRAAVDSERVCGSCATTQQGTNHNRTTEATALAAVASRVRREGLGQSSSCSKGKAPRLPSHRISLRQQQHKQCECGSHVGQGRKASGAAAGAAESATSPARCSPWPWESPPPARPVTSPGVLRLKKADCGAREP